MNEKIVIAQIIFQISTSAIKVRKTKIGRRQTKVYFHDMLADRILLLSNTCSCVERVGLNFSTPHPE